jgi:hypothetical protein
MRKRALSEGVLNENFAFSVFIFPVWGSGTRSGAGDRLQSPQRAQGPSDDLHL